MCQIPLSMGRFRRQFIGFDNKNFNVSRYSPFVQINDAMMTSSNGSIFRFTGHLCGMASQITSLTSVYSTVYSGAVQRKYLSSPSLAFVRGIHRWPVNFPTQRPVTRGFNVFFDLRPNKRLRKQWWGWWFYTPSRPLSFSWRVYCIVLDLLELRGLPIVYTADLLRTKTCWPCCIKWRPVMLTYFYRNLNKCWYILNIAAFYIIHRG